MDWLRLTIDAIPNLTQTVLSLIITISLLTVKEKSRPTKLLVLCFIGITLSLSASFITAAVYAPWQIYFFPLQQLPLLASYIALIQFAYYYPRIFFPREARLVLYGSVLIAFMGLCQTIKYLYIWKTRQQFSALPSFDPLSTLIFVELIWYIFVLLRQTVRLSETAAAHQSVTHADTAAHSFFHWIIKPFGKQAEATRAFALIRLIGIIILAAFIAKGHGNISVEFYTIITHICLLLYLFIFVRIYLNNSLEPTPIRIKLMLSMLTIMLVALGLVGIITIPYFERAYENERLLEVASVRQQLNSLPGRAADLIADRLPPAIIAIVSYPVNSAASPSFFETKFNRGLTIDMAALFPQDGKARAQVLASAQQIDLRTDQSRKIARKIGDGYYDTVVSFPFIEGDKIYEVWFSEAAHRQYIHRVALPLAELIPLFTIIIIFVVPFFLTSFVNPLDALLAGVKKVDEGDLNIVVPIIYRDEIGYLASSFNAMVRSIQDAKVAERRQLEHQQQEEIRALELKRKTEELEFARKMQLSMLPAKDIELDNIEIIGKMITATEVGGDYYDFIELPDKRYCIAIGDATGHGVAAGLVVGMAKMGLMNELQMLNGNLTLKRLVQDLNLALKRSLTHRGMGICFGVTILDLANLTAEISSNGMPYPYHYQQASGELLPLKLVAPPLGFLKQIAVNTQQLKLEAGDALIWLSDGFSERQNRQQELWGNIRLEAALKRICQGEQQAKVIAEQLIAECHEAAENLENNDDLTIVVMRVKAPHG